MPLASFLFAIVGSLVGRVLASLGFAVITIRGVEAAIGGIRFLLLDAVNSLPAEMFQLFLLAGGGAALNIVLAAVSFRVSLWTITKSVRVLGIKA